MLIIGMGIGLLIGIVIGIYVGMDKNSRFSGSKVNQYELKEDNIAKLKEFIKGKKEITNKDVEDLLNMSDPTATRYLDKLEEAGLVKQVGKVGRGVKYEVKK